jgi:hypothetical protein
MTMARAQRENRNHADEPWEEDPPRQRPDWAAKLMAQAAATITALWQPKNIEVYVAVGTELNNAKRALKEADPPGLFLFWVRTELPFKEDTAERLMRIAAHERLSDSANWRNLPRSMRTNAELARLTVEQFDAWMNNGWISPEMKFSHAAAAVKALTKEKERDEQEDKPSPSEDDEALKEARSEYLKCLKPMSTKRRAAELLELFKLVLTPADELIAERMKRARWEQAAADSMAAMRMEFGA